MLSTVIGSMVFMSMGIPSTNTSGSEFPSVLMPLIFIAAASPPGNPEFCCTCKPVTPPCSDCDSDVMGLPTMLDCTLSDAMELAMCLRCCSLIPTTTTSSNDDTCC